MQALIHHFKLYTEGFHTPAGEVYAVVEAPKGEFGLSSLADGTKTRTAPRSAPRLRPSPGDGLSLPKAMLADVSAILGSLDIVFGEVDRMTAATFQAPAGVLADRRRGGLARP